MATRVGVGTRRAQARRWGQPRARSPRPRRPLCGRFKENKTEKEELHLEGRVMLNGHKTVVFA
jgi:hypothetical protein